ncbi:MAG: FAD-binding protein [Proteobacteria bacterium]|nr:FAD-binding protein [Pseudomonadota bacterium]
MSAPPDEAGIADAIREAAGRGEPLAIEGFASKRGMLRPVQAAATLSTRNLTGITLYSPRELILSARAGTPLAEIEAALAEHNQHLIAEPPDLSGLFGEPVAQSWGGVVATNLSGPRRIAWGAMRDHVMGIRAVNGRGEVIRSGGRVLKNVTGLDLAKLLTGSHGTLGVLTEITVKVLPAPEGTGSLVIRGLDATAGVAALAAALGSPFGVSGAAWLPAWAAAGVPALGEGSATVIRMEEFPSSVTYRLGRLVGDLAAFGASAMLDDAASRAVWSAIGRVDPLRPEAGEAVWLVSTRPSRGPALLAASESAGARGFLDWGGGRIWLAGPGSEALHRAIGAAVRAQGGTWTLMRAPAPLRTAVDVVPAEAPALAVITRRVKASLDPAGVLNPGRLYAGL